MSAATLDPPVEGVDRTFRVGLLIAAVLVVLFYGSTVSHWIGLGDTALVIDEMVRLEVNSHVNNHTIAIVSGWLFSKLPFGELALRMNLMSVFYGSIAVVLVYVIAYRTVKNVVLALMAAASVAVMHSMWWHSTIVENYAINAVALLTCFLLLLKDEEREDERCYYGACAVAGLGVVNHVQMGILAIAVFVYAIQRRDGLVVRLVKMAGAFLVGFMPYLVVLLHDISKSGDLKKTVYWALGGDFQSRMFDLSLARVFRPLLTEFLLAFPSPLMLLAAVGVFWIGERAWYPRTNIAMTIAFFINTIFFGLFHTWDRFAFLLPSFLVVAYWGIVGVRAVNEWAKDTNRPWARKTLQGALVVSMLWPPFFYRALPGWGVNEGFWHSRFNNNYTANSHNCATYIADPNKSRWNDVDEFSKLLFAKLPPRAVFLDDDSRIYYPLHDYYQKYYGYRPDVSVRMINSWGFSNWGVSGDKLVALARRWLQTRPVFLVSIQSPLDAAVAQLAEHGIVAKRFALDETHWVYQLEATSGQALAVHDMYTGRGFDGGVPVIKSTFQSHEVIATRVHFAENDAPVTVSFVWTDAAGKVVFTSEPFTIEPGNNSVASHFDGDKSPGAWRVELRVDGDTLSSASLTIRQ